MKNHVTAKRMLSWLLVFAMIATIALGSGGIRVKAVEGESAAASTEQYPFPHNARGYAEGTILPSVSQDEMNAAMLKMYERWREVYLTTEGCEEGEVRVSGGTNYSMGTCSEGTGYGMLLSVYMANSGNQAHEDFDGIVRYIQNHSDPVSGLMCWKMDKDGKVLDKYAAPDGDLDNAVALLMAHKQWGSDGEINYLELAETLINNIMRYAVNKPTDTSVYTQMITEAPYTIARCQIEQKYTDQGRHWMSNTMSSYQMPAAARLFGEVTGDEEWAKVVEGIYSLYDYYSKKNTAGLAPYKFTVAQTKESSPAAWEPTKASEGRYGFDSCRTPWRVTLDYLWNGNVDLAHDYPIQVATWFTDYMTNTLNWDFDSVNASFELDGTEQATYASPRNIVSMLAPAAMVGESNRELLDKCYEYLSNITLTHDWPGDYYQDTLVLMGMLTITGNMPNFYDLEPYPDNAMPEIEVTDTVAPSKPENFRVVAMTVADKAAGSSVSFAWEPSVDDGEGRVFYSIYKDDYLCYAPVAAGTDEVPVVVQFLDAGKTYQFTVVAQDEAGNKIASDTITVTILSEEDDDHTITEVRGAKEATCTEDGYTGDEVCTVCFAVVKEGEVIPALGHDYQSVVVEPTETEQGYTEHTCKVCGDVYRDNYTDYVPEDTEPEVTEPEVTEPEVTEPEVTDPETTEPEVPATSKPAGEDDSADTGDAFQTAWIFMMVLSMMGAAVLLAVSKKRFVK